MVKCVKLTIGALLMRLFELLKKLFIGLDTLDKQVTFIIALAGFLMSFVSWIYVFTKERKKLSIKAITYDSGYRNGDVTGTELRFFYVIIENKSRLSISITDIAVLYNEDIFHCSPVAVQMLSVTGRTKGQVVGRKATDSLAMPINIQGLCAQSGYLLFASPKHTLPTDATEVTLQVATTRGGLTVCVDLSQTDRHRSMYELRIT